MTHEASILVVRDLHESRLQSCRRTSWAHKRLLAVLAVALGPAPARACTMFPQDGEAKPTVRASDFLGKDLSELLQSLRERDRQEIAFAISRWTEAGSDPATTMLQDYLEDVLPQEPRDLSALSDVTAALGGLMASQPELLPSAAAYDLVARGDLAAMALLAERLPYARELSSLSWEKEAWFGKSANLVGLTVGRWTLQEWLLEMAQVHIFDQTDLAARETLDASILAKMAALGQSMVSIQYLPPGADRSRASPKGVGFLWKDKVLTAAHVITTWARDESGGIDLGRLILVFPDEEGRFDPSSELVSGVQPLGGGSTLLPRWDTAALAPSVDSTNGTGPAVDWLKKGRQEPLQSGAADADLRRGLVFAITAFPMGGSLRVALVAPGPIVFAPRADVPPLDRLDSGSDEFRRAFRFEFFSRLFDSQLLARSGDLSVLPENAYDALVSIADGGPAYVVASANSHTSRRFAVRTGSIDQLVRFAPEDTQFAVDRCIEVFGCDLVTLDGMSGSPVFLLEEGVLRVVGLHVAAARSPSARVVFPHTRNVALAVPFHRILPNLK